VFITIEDETGVVNLVVWPKVFETYRPVVMGARFVLVRGRLQRAPDSEGAVVHLVVEHMEDRSADLSLLTNPDETMKSMLSPADGAATSAPDRRERPRGWNDDPRSAHADGHGHARVHPRNVRVLPRSRDFH
jgi:error-prone DNA polymerase